MKAKTYTMKETIDRAQPIVIAKVSRVGGKSGGQPLRVIYQGKELCLTNHCKMAR